MCELFAVNAGKKENVDELLREFFSHSSEHANGWGIAVFDGTEVNVEREPIRALDSLYLRNRLTGRFEVKNMLAHIRKATIGNVEYRNTHPFVAQDISGRKWTLIHNGTIFEAHVLEPYLHKQEGTTDSERILLYIVDRINAMLTDDMNSFDVNERFLILEEITRDLSPENKLNLCLYDGEYLYVHKNSAGTLYILEKDGAAYFSTQPLGRGNWNEVPQNRLLVYKDGQRIYVGDKHPYSYVENEHHLRTLYMEFAGL